MSDDMVASVILVLDIPRHRRTLIEPAPSEKAAAGYQTRYCGGRFEAYLPPDLADWLLGMIERGDFVDPSEAVFVILGVHQELEPHADLRAEIQRRADRAALDDPRPGIPQEKMNERLQELIVQPR